MNPCYYKNQNSFSLRHSDNYYYLLINELCQFQEVQDNKPQTLKELIGSVHNLDLLDNSKNEENPRFKRGETFTANIQGFSMKNLLN